MTQLMQASRQWASRPDDERFTNLIDLRDHVAGERARSRAGVVSTREITLQPDASDAEYKGLQIVGKAGNPFNPTHFSFGQLAGLAKAPAGYLRTLPAPIVADAMNYGLRFNRDAEDVGVLLYQNGNAILRAATGPGYGRVWNEDVANSLVQRFGNGVGDTDWRVPGEFGKHVEVTKANTTLYASDRDMFVFLADETNRIENPDRRPGENHSLARGFFVWNSEVGSTSLGAAFFLFDYACCNRIVWGAKQFKEIRLRHTKSAPARWIEEITPVLVEYANASAKPVMETIAAAKAKKLGDDMAEFLGKRFTTRMASNIMAAHEREEGRPAETLWDAVTGMTAHAKTIRWQDERVAIERDAGKLLDLVAA
jgi:hypothetical protein